LQRPAAEGSPEQAVLQATPDSADKHTLPLALLRPTQPRSVRAARTAMLNSGHDFPAEPRESLSFFGRRGSSFSLTLHFRRLLVCGHNAPPLNDGGDTDRKHQQR
jgi:hypothetical protein